MKPPADVWIAPHLWTLQSDRVGIAIARGETDQDTMGWTERSKLVIGIDPEAPASIKREALLHETLHAVFATCGGPLDDPVPTFEGEDAALEEHVIARITPILLDVIRTNPKLIEFLLEGVK